MHNPDFVFMPETNIYRSEYLEDFEENKLD